MKRSSGHGEETLQSARGVGATNSGPTHRRPTKNSSETPVPAEPQQYRQRKALGAGAPGANAAGMGAAADGRRAAKRESDRIKELEMLEKKVVKAQQWLANAVGSPGPAKTAKVAPLPEAGNGKF